MCRIICFGIIFTELSYNFYIVSELHKNLQVFLHNLKYIYNTLDEKFCLISLLGKDPEISVNNKNALNNGLTKALNCVKIFNSYEDIFFFVYNTCT